MQTDVWGCTHVTLKIQTFIKVVARVRGWWPQAGHLLALAEHIFGTSLFSLYFTLLYFTLLYTWGRGSSPLVEGDLLSPNFLCRF
jgi:hypothetical protein